MKNLVFGIVGIMIMILSFMVPSGGIELPTLPDFVWISATIAFLIVGFLTQSYLKTNHKEQYSRCENRVPKIF